MSEILNGPSISKHDKPEKIIFMLHGYGDNAANFLHLANPIDQDEWKALYVALNAPNYITGNLMGYQWFDLYPNGIYISAKNTSLKFLNLRRSNFTLIGSAHNIKEISFKKKQGCKNILLSRLFQVTYKPHLNYLGVIRFNKYVLNIDKNIIPLGGINLSNLNNTKIINSYGFAMMTEIKKKPANIINRLF